MVGTAYPMKVSPKLLETVPTRRAGGDRPGQRAVELHPCGQAVATRARASSIHGGNRALMRRMQRGYAAGNLFHADFTACDAYAGLEAAASQGALPGDAGAGRARPDDAATGGGSRSSRRCKPRVVTLPVGHNLMAEAPDGVLNAINEALNPGGSTHEPPRQRCDRLPGGYLYFFLPRSMIVVVMLGITARRHRLGSCILLRLLGFLVAALLTFGHGKSSCCTAARWSDA